MSATISIHSKSFTARTSLFGENSERGSFATIDLDDGGLDVRIFLSTTAQCDDLIKAAVAAKDMLHAHQHAATMTDPLAPLRDREHYETATEDEGHDGSSDGDEACLRCGAVNWGQTRAGQPVCASCGYIDDEPISTSAPERTATPAEHADTAERIERARTEHDVGRKEGRG